MNNQSKNTLITVVVVLLIGGGLGLIGAIIFNHSADTGQDWVVREKPKEQVPPEKETVAPKLTQEESGELRAGEPPGDCLAIMGDEACFGETWVKAGDMLGEAKVLEVGVAEVTFAWQGGIIIRPLADVDVDQSLSKDRIAKLEADILDKFTKESAAINEIVTKAEAAFFSTRQGYNDIRDPIYRAFYDGKLSQEDAMARIERTVRRAVAAGGLFQEEAQAELDKARTIIYQREITVKL